MGLIKRLSHCNCDKLTNPSRPGWFERFLLAILPHFDIVKTVDGVTQLYLRRFYIWRQKWISPHDTFNIYLHHILKSDDDKDPHDHPWNFWTLILKEGYVDEQWSYSWTKEMRAVTKVIVVYDKWKFWRHKPILEEVRPGRLIYRRAEHIHRVIADKPAWTLVVTGPYRRDWEFVTEDGPIMWRKYLGIPDNVDYGE